MPLKLTFKRTHRYNVAAKDLHVIRIYTLDNTCVEYTVSSNTTGRDALDYVAQRLDIEDTYFFGFTYEDWVGEQRCLFLSKSIKKQLDKYARQHALTLTVMLFIDNPQFVPDPQIRRWFYLQLRRNVSTGLLPVTLKLAIKLQAYSLQAEFGDFVDVETTLSNWRERNLQSETSVIGAFDLSTTEYVDDIVWGYSHLQGVSQDNAIWYFLDEIRHNPLYGVRTFTGMTCRNEVAELGVSRNGINITTFEPQRQIIANLKWEHIKDLTYARKTFTIQLLKKGKSVHFIFEDYESARYLWQFCIQMHSSYIDYWTHVKSVPPQPAVHISEPPDILRGTELRCTHSGSPVLNEYVADLAPQQPNQQYAKYDVEVVNDKSQRTPNKEDPHSVKLINPHKLLNQFKIESSNTVLSSDNKTFRINPSPRRPSEATCIVSYSSNSIQNNFVDKITTANSDFKEQHVDSESGTLVGHWSLRSGAGTLDSQFLNKGCVTCLPGRECLKPTGWFLSKNGSTNTTSISTEPKIDFTDPPSSTASIPLAPHTNKGIQTNHKDSSSVQHEQHNTIDVNQDHKISKGHRSHKHRQTKRHRQGRKQANTVFTSKVENSHEDINYCEPLTSLHLSTVNVVGKGEVCTGQSSPSSLASSDSSSEHVLVSPRASFSSSSSSYTASIKKIDLVHAVQHHSSSSSTSSSSSASITQADFESNEARKTSFGFAASLCTSANNVTFKNSSKSNTRGINSTSGSTFSNGRKLWQELIQSNSGGILPLLSGLSQRHYRPQSQMKRCQATTSMTPDSIVQEPNLEGVTIRQNRHNFKETVHELSSHIHKSTTHFSSSNNPLHEFQRWFSSAKHRIPFGWTNSVISRETTVNISSPLPYQTSGNSCQSPITKPEIEKCSGVISNPLSPATHQNLSNQSILNTGRLERSSSESYSRPVSSGLNNPRTILVNLEQSVMNDANSNKPKLPTKNSKNTSENESKVLTPTIHLLPPSPTRPSFKISGSKPTNSEKSDLRDINVLLTSCSNFNGTPGEVKIETKHLNSSNVYNKFNMNESVFAPEPKDNYLSSLQSKNAQPLNQLTQQEQGNFRTSVSSSCRLLPCPLSLNEVNRLAVTPPRKFANSTSNNCYVSLTECHSNKLMYSASEYQQSDFDHRVLVNPDTSRTTFTKVTCKEDVDEKRQVLNHVNDNMSQRQYSTTPATPVSRPNLLWEESFNRSYGHKNTPEISHSLLQQDGCNYKQQANVNSNESTIKLTNDNKECNLATNVWSSNNQSESKSLAGNRNYIAEAMENSQELENKPSSNTLLTTSSSSDQSSIPRPSSGTMHLLTNSDIHQLLSLTNLRETELAHRLLAEYRQVLLQQQSLHANSVSTPNLSASQELHMFSSSTAADDIDGQEGQISTSTPEKSRHTTWNKQSDELRQTSNKCDKTNLIASNSTRDQSEVPNNGQTGLRLKVRCNRNVEIQSIDSPDYVNASAFRNDRRHTNDRPLSLASSTDIDSNATFRVLSSFEMRTSSGGNYSTGNLILPNCSIGSEATMGLSVDLTNPDSQPGVESVTSRSSSRSWDQQQKSTEGSILENHRNNNSSREVCSHDNVTREDVDNPNICNQAPDLCVIQKGTSFPTKEYLNKPRFKVQYNHLNSINSQCTQRRYAIGEYENLEAISYEKSKKNYLSNHLHKSTHAQATLYKNMVSICNTPPESLTTLTYSGGSTSPSLSTYSESSSTLSSSSPYSDLGCIDLNHKAPSRKHLATMKSTNTRNEIKHSSPWGQLFHYERGMKSDRNHKTDEWHHDMASNIITPRFKKHNRYCNCSCHKSCGHLKITKGNSSRTDTTNNLSLIDVSNPPGCRRIKQKARSFEPFSNIINASPPGHNYTSVYFEDVNKGVVPSGSASSNIQEYQRRHIKSSNRRSHRINTSHIPININRSNHSSCCCCEQLDFHSHNDVSHSVTTSPTNSPDLSSASSYSFSTSSLDVQPAFDCPHHLHIPSYASVVIAHKIGRNYRSGSLEPSNVINRRSLHKSKLKHVNECPKCRPSIRKEFQDNNSQSTGSVGLHYTETYKREHCSCCKFHESTTKRDFLGHYNRMNSNYNYDSINSNNNKANYTATNNKSTHHLPSCLPFPDSNNDNDLSTYSKQSEHDLNNGEKSRIIVKRKSTELNSGNTIDYHHTYRGEHYSKYNNKLTDTQFTTKDIDSNDNDNDTNSYSHNHYNKSIENFENEASAKPPRPKDLKVLSRNHNFSPVDLTKYRSSSGKRISFFKRKIPSESQIMAHSQLQGVNMSTERQTNQFSLGSKRNLAAPIESINTPLPSPDLLCRPNGTKNDFSTGVRRPPKVSDCRRETLMKTHDPNKLHYQKCYQESENYRKPGSKCSSVSERFQLKESHGSNRSTLTVACRESNNSPTQSTKQKLSLTSELSPSPALVYTASVVFSPKQQSNANTMNSKQSSVAYEKTRAYDFQLESRTIPHVFNGCMEPDDSNKRNTTLKKDSISAIPFTGTDNICIQNDIMLKNGSHAN
ncbi:hypothetical protein MN116_002317 [Schistosoma mekongi]|uniref:FERM domain-containing protein n=1 Tax=Schistosoma mekongi TaxID=38744 RepID=A0AAE2D8Q8_SCHME|nr:hypothetical protein MN116_002317 [Schistosoma mekongi]